MEVNQFTFRESIICFRKYGNGSKILLAFHGFGQNHQAFSKLSNQPEREYAIYSIDLFFHGGSKWNYDEKPLEKVFWKELITAFLSQNSIDECGVIGYSMGAKFALASLEAIPEKINSITLLAPDGIYVSPWYTLTTHLWTIRMLFKRTIKHPKLFYSISRLVNSIGLIDKSVLRFVESQMNTESKRSQAYYSWIVFRHLKFKMKTIADLINKSGMHCEIVIGRYDKIITPDKMERLSDKLNKPSIQLIEASHQNLINKWAEKIVKS